MDWKLELVAIPVSDVDRAKAFYTEQFFKDPDGNGWTVQELPPWTSGSQSVSR